MEDGICSYSSSLYDTSSLFQFCNDDSASASSNMEVTDRIASLEQRVQIQEDEIQLLKSAIADVVRRLNISEEQHVLQNRKGPTKARPLVQTLPLRNAVNSESILPKKPSGSLPSPSGIKKDIVPLASKSNVKRTNSIERISPGVRRESSGDAKGGRNRAGSTSSSSSGKKNSDSKPKEPMFSAVTVQILLAAQLLDSIKKETESTDRLTELHMPTISESGQVSSDSPKSHSLPLVKSPSQTSLPFPMSPSFKSPKSPGSYFQLCY